MPVSWTQVQFPGPSQSGHLCPSLVLDLVVLEQVLPQRDLGGKLGRAEVAADGVLGVRVQEPHVVLQARDVGVVLIVRNAQGSAFAILFLNKWSGYRLFGYC